MSGMPFQSAIETPTLDGLPLTAAVRSYAMTPLQTEPGTHYQYSNAGINTAARILEVVSGMKYEDFMQTRLFDPLGMKDTTFWPNEEQAARVANSYRPDAAKTNLRGDSCRPAHLSADRSGAPFSHACRRTFFHRAGHRRIFCQMLLNGGELNGHRYLSEEAFKELTKRQTPESVKEKLWLSDSPSAPIGSGTAGRIRQTWKSASRKD